MGTAGYAPTGGEAQHADAHTAAKASLVSKPSIW
jgi:hypothetical protein